MFGKKKCSLLKRIRKKIAKENNIPYETTECNFQGDCAGTCPKCEEEVRYLEQELEKRKSDGTPVTVSGIAADMVAPTPAHPIEYPEHLRNFVVPPHILEKQAENAQLTMELERMRMEQSMLLPGVVRPPVNNPLEEFNSKEGKNHERKEQMPDFEGHPKKDC